MPQINLTTNKSVNTPFLGLGTGDTINSIVLALIQVGVDDVGHTDLSVQANLDYAAGHAVNTSYRGLQLASPGFSAIQTTAGYTFDLASTGITLVNGATYVPALQITENMAGGGTQTGKWVAGAPVVYNASGFSDTATWGTSTAGGGTSTVTSSLVTLDSQNGAGISKGAILFNKTGVVKAASHTIKSKVALTSSNGANDSVYGLSLAQALPSVDSVANVFADYYQHCGIYFTYSGGEWGISAVMALPGSPAPVYKWVAGSWQTSASWWTLGNYPITPGTVYTLIITTTATGVSFAVKSADESTTIFQTTEQPWSSLQKPSALGSIPATLYPFMGDPFTDSMGEQIQISGYSAV